MVHFSFSHQEEGMSTLDQYVAPGLRLWMLIGIVGGVLLIMIIIVCCFMKIRIPRTKREIELNAAQRKMRKTAKNKQNINSNIISGSVVNGSRNNYGQKNATEENKHHRKNQTIVMNSSKNQQQTFPNIVKREPLPSRSANV